MSKFSGKIGTELDGKTRLPEGTSSALKELLVDYMPYDERDDTYKYAQDLLQDENYGAIFDKFEFSNENLKYFEDKYKRIESEQFNDFLVNSFLENKEHKCIIDDMDSKFPEVKNRYEKTLMARLELHKRIAKLVIHGLKDPDDYVLIYLLTSNKIKYNSILLGAMLTRENIAFWGSLLTYDTFNSLINTQTNFTFNINDPNITDNEISAIIKTMRTWSNSSLRLLVNADYDPGSIYDLVYYNTLNELKKQIILSILSGGLYEKPYWDQVNPNQLTPDEYIELVRTFKDNINNIISGRGLFNPRNYDNSNITIFQLNTRIVNGYGFTGLGTTPFFRSYEGHRNPYSGNRGIQSKPLVDFTGTPSSRYVDFTQSRRDTFQPRLT